MDYMDKHDGWTHIPLRHLWNFGYRADSMLRIISSCPPALCSALQRMFDRIYCLSEDVHVRLHWKTNAAGSNPGVIISHDDNIFRHKPEVEDAEFESKTEYALLKIDFDPVDQSKLNILVNSRAASLWNMKKDEFLLRFATYDLPLPCLELDWLRFLVVYMQDYFLDMTSYYLRFLSVGSTQALLVSLTSKKTFNAIGRITQ